MRMGVYAIALLVGSVFLVTGCIEQMGVEIENDAVFETGSLCLIDRFDLIYPSNGQGIYPDTVVKVGVLASNAGDEVGMMDFYFSVNERVILGKTLSFRPGEEQTIGFSTFCSDCVDGQSYLAEPGSYTLAVNDFEIVIEVLDPPVELTIEGIEWQETGSLDYPRYVPYVSVYVVNTCDERFPVDSWEFIIMDQVCSNVVVTKFSTLSVLEPFAEGRIVLKPNGVFSLTEDGSDIDLQVLRLRNQSQKGLQGCVLGETEI